MQNIQSYWKQDKEYVAVVADLLENELLQELDTITHHHYTTRLNHSIFVSYVSYSIAKKFNLNYRSVARAGLLHDFFIEGREDIKQLKKGSHNYVHPKLALENAKKITEINDIEADIILKHMFLCTRCTFPKFKESFIVTFVDKYCAINEVSHPTREKVANAIATLKLKLKLA